MNPEGLFSLVNTVALIGWIGLVFFSRWQHTTRWVSGILIPTLLAFAYSGLIGLHLQGAEGGFDSLAGIRQLFNDPHLLLAGWIHYLAFD